MDYTKIPPQLICKERRSLEEFANGNVLNTKIVDNLLDFYYFQFPPNFKERALKCFNAAYYICTLMLTEEHPEWSLLHYYDSACCKEENADVYQAVTLSLVCIYTHWFGNEWNEKHKSMLERMDSFIKSHYLDDAIPIPPGFTYKDAYNQLSQGITTDIIFPNGEFSLRKIDKEAIEDLQASRFNWTNLTEDYRYEIMEDIIYTLGKDDEEKELLRESFGHNARSYYGESNDYFKNIVVMRLDKLWHKIYGINYNETRKKIRQKKTKTESQKSLQEGVNQLNRRIAELEAELQRVVEENVGLKRQIDLQGNESESELDKKSQTGKEMSFTLRERIVFFMTVLSLENNKKYTHKSNLATFISAMCKDQHNIGPLISKMEKKEHASANAKAAKNVASQMKLILPEEYRENEHQKINKLIKSMIDNFPEKEEE